MDSFTLKNKLKNGLVILPIGAVEAHGHHLPIDIDAKLATSYAKHVQIAIGGIVYPTINYGQVWGLHNFSGSTSISNQVLEQTIVQIAQSLQKDQVNTLVLLNCHVGNLNAIKSAARIIYDQKIVQHVYYFTYPGLEQNYEIFTTKKNPYGFLHADEIETSIALYLTPELVCLDKIIDEEVKIPLKMSFSPMKWNHFTKHALLGKPSLATREKGEKVIKASIAIIKEVINDSKT